MRAAMIHIAIADNHRLMRECLRCILAGEADMRVVGEARNDLELLSHVRAGQADVLLLDWSMPGSGTELIRTIRQAEPALGILVLSMHDEALFALRAIRAGANGYFHKRQAAQELIGAIRLAASGRQYISPQVADQLAADLMASHVTIRHDRLTAREFEIFSMLVAGLTMTATAAALGVSVKTVSTHKTRMLAKMGLQNLAQLVRYAMAHDLLPVPALPGSGLQPRRP